MTKWVDVAAGVLVRADGRFLLGQRAQGTYYPGYWEFPGGKVELGETPAQALVRELNEELGIEVQTLHPWLVREYHYEHASVRLHFFRVLRWCGALVDHVHSALSWQDPEAPDANPMLPANGPVLKALRLPNFMGITHAWAVGIEPQLALIDAALERGLRLIQVREPGLTGVAFERFAREVVRRARQCGARVLVNGDSGLAQRVGADGIHLKAHELARLSGRPECLEWVGASCHTREELLRAARLELDYAVVGAVCSTPTHPERAPLGWHAFRAMREGLPFPVFALGGLDAGDLVCAQQAGAHGVAAIRGAWEVGSGLRDLWP